MNNKIKFTYKIAFFALSVFLMLGMVNVKAGNQGYTYDSKGKPIYSTEGFTVNELPVTYSDLGIKGDATPSDLFVFDVDMNDPITDTMGDEIIYMTDSQLDTVFVLNSNLQLEHSLNKFKLIPSKLYETNALTISTKSVDASNNKTSKILFANEDAIPTDAELNDPNGAYGGKGYIEIELLKPTSAYRAVSPNTKKDLIYICDTGNRQVLVLDASTWDGTTYEVYQVVTKPVDEMEADVAFEPKKIITDISGRMYIISNNVFDGIMQFSVEGTFDRYTGTNEITLSAWDIFWRNFSSEEQLAKQPTLINTTFNSMVYYNQMIYTTSLHIENSDGTINDKVMIKKINPSGEDILSRNGYTVPMGDVKYATTNDINGSATYPSSLVGITVNPLNGVFSVLDSKRGRIFTYDDQGNLLYISGGEGTQADKLKTPVSIQYLGSNLIVLNASNDTIVKFELTEIAEVINNAVTEEFKGHRSRIKPEFNTRTQTWWIAPPNTSRQIDTKIGNPNAVLTEVNGHWYIDGKDSGVEVDTLAAADYWEEVIRLNANYEYAYVGLGHKYMEDGDFETAMRYFELGKNKEYYSKAFKQYRDAIIKEWFAPVVIVCAVLIIGTKTYKFVRNKKLGIRKEEETGVGDE